MKRLSHAYYSEKMPMLKDNELAYDRYKIRPRILRNINSADPSTTIFGTKTSFPFGFAPCAAHKVGHPDGENGVSRAAASNNIPMCLSSWATTSLEEVKACGATNPYIIHVSLLKDPSSAPRNRVDYHHPIGYGPTQTWKSGSKESTRPKTSPSPSTTASTESSSPTTAVDVLRECAPIARGKIAIALDGGIRRGSDLFKAIALGAQFCFAGRVAIWGLAYKGEAGVDLAIKILYNEFLATMMLAGSCILSLFRIADSGPKFGDRTLQSTSVVENGQEYTTSYQTRQMYLCILPQWKEMQFPSRLCFIALGSHILTLPLDDNGDLTVSAILHISRDDPVVLKAVLAVGGSYCIRHLAPNTEEREHLIHITHELLQSVQQFKASRVANLHAVNMNKAEKLRECYALLLIHLLLYFYEISEGAGDKSWQTHLDGARDVIFLALHECDNLTTEGPPNQNESFDDPPSERNDEGDLEVCQIRDVIMQLFLYHEVFASVMDPRPICGLFNGNLDGFPQDPLLNNLATVQTMHAGLFGIVTQIAVLQSNVRMLCISPGDVISEAASLWKDLNDWKHPAGGSGSYSSLNTCEAFIASSFIWLFSILYPENPTDGKVQAMVQRGVEGLTCMELAELQSCPLLPIFVIGMACVDDADRRTLEDHIGRLEDVRRLGNVGVCRGVLRRAWMRYDGGDKQSWNWLRLMEEEDVIVPVF
ncbi:hypothetical protein FE257_005394 [Aspergillus nanangensis]|uniref:FMN hydroxy acid dehydrogenase domain-containing protein n=1 Tax=Aspergillus nanangensis TaxID=2582783 RepID=A0AAD4CS75_ASPNN|nr:hypothetical protein FE257_005394 [Aspergillus nanangensis]